MASISVELISSEGPVCPICFDVFTSPRQLPCMHSFCQKCLQDFIAKLNDSKGEFGKEFMCPVCRASTNPPKTEKPIGEWASLYPRSPISVIEGPKVKLERYCSGCQYAGESNTAQGFCLVCEETLCNACLIAHKRTKLTREHKVISMEELNSNKEYLMMFAEGFGCPYHQDKHIEYYCESHEVVCCTDCFLSEHITCDQVKNLNEDLPSILSDIMPEEIIEQMKKIEKHLQTFTMTNESNIGKLEAAITNLAAEIRAVKTKVDERLDEIERMVTTEGNKIYREEKIRRQEENHQCKCLIIAVRNSYTFLESVQKYGTDTQKFHVSKKLITQLKAYIVQIREKYEEIESVQVQLELDSLLEKLLFPDLSNIVKSKGYHNSFPCSGISEGVVSSSTRKPLRKSHIKLASVVDIQCPSKKIPIYTGGVQLPGGDIVLADSNNMTFILYDSTYQFVTMYTLPSKPMSMSLLHENEVAVTLPDLKTVQFLSVRDKSIRDTGTVQTRYVCFGVTSISIGEVVVTGRVDDKKKCYWSLVDRTAGERCIHEFACLDISGAYVATNNSKSRVYISVELGNALYCFGLTDGRKYFVYTSNDLKYPRGVAVDRENNVYVVGGNSDNIHKLSPDGISLQVIKSGVPENPIRLFFDENREGFFVTSRSLNQSTKLHMFVYQ